MPRQSTPSNVAMIRIGTCVLQNSASSGKCGLITYLLTKLPEDERVKIVAELQIDLSPASRKQHRHEGSLEKIDVQPVAAGAPG